jgi:hypothetical protein
LARYFMLCCTVCRRWRLARNDDDNHIVELNDCVGWAATSRHGGRNLH